MDMESGIEIASPMPAARLRLARDDRNVGLCWKDTVPAQKLLDAIASIIAEEYIQVAKKNPEVFKGSK